MFYSQFILAKKGPLGTIWIAAHLERKLRKNQVADTDIGVSVDSILAPDVPIALRLSSHLLLGVVRIYNRKVNYLFDDCSEALLKVKQAFRSTAVDLPPEQSKAPYHSITLPETFDLDDFELPDNDNFQGNLVDHHVSSRDQITLQDTMDGVTLSTSRFGLDERFGDADTSGVDLDEELFLDKVGTSSNVNVSVDPQSSDQIVAPIKHDHHDPMTPHLEPMFDEVDEDDLMDDDAQAPRTPGLLEEPNLSNAHETSACEDRFETEERHLTEAIMKEDLGKMSGENNAHDQNKHVVDWSIPDMNSDTVIHMAPEVGRHFSDLDFKKPQEVAVEQKSRDNHASAFGTSSRVDNHAFSVSDLAELRPEEIFYNQKDNVDSNTSLGNNERSDEGHVEKSSNDFCLPANFNQQVLQNVPTSSTMEASQNMDNVDIGSQEKAENQTYKEPIALSMNNNWNLEEEYNFLVRCKANQGSNSEGNQSIDPKPCNVNETPSSVQGNTALDGSENVTLGDTTRDPSLDGLSHAAGGIPFPVDNGKSIENQVENIYFPGSPAGLAPEKQMPVHNVENMYFSGSPAPAVLDPEKQMSVHNVENTYFSGSPAVLAPEKQMSVPNVENIYFPGNPAVLAPEKQMSATNVENVYLKQMFATNVENVYFSGSPAVLAPEKQMSATNVENIYFSGSPAVLAPEKQSSATNVENIYFSGSPAVLAPPEKQRSNVENMYFSGSPAPAVLAPEKQRSATNVENMYFSPAGLAPEKQRSVTSVENMYYSGSPAVLAPPEKQRSVSNVENMYFSGSPAPAVLAPEKQRSVTNVENIYFSGSPGVFAPEKLRSVTNIADNHPANLAMGYTPGGFARNDEGDSGSNFIYGKKRTYTESSQTEQSLYTVGSSGIAQSKRTVESFRDDEDFLSSILGGRNTSIFKVRPTPSPQATSSVKRRRTVPNSGTPKRKILIDDSMVLHGDTIRKQLMNTEDIRRVRKKAPCTRPEILIIQKQFLEDKMFIEPICTGLSTKLAALHNQTHDLGGIVVNVDDVVCASPELGTKGIQEHNNFNLNTEVVEGNTEVMEGNTEVVEGNTEVVEGSTAQEVMKESSKEEEDQGLMVEGNTEVVEGYTAQEVMKESSKEEENQGLMVEGNAWQETIDAHPVLVDAQDGDCKSGLPDAVIESESKTIADAEENCSLLEPTDTELVERPASVTDVVNTTAAESSLLSELVSGDHVTISADLAQVTTSADKFAGDHVAISADLAQVAASADKFAGDAQFPDINIISEDIPLHNDANMQKDEKADEVNLEIGSDDKDVVEDFGNVTAEEVAPLADEEKLLDTTEGNATVETQEVAPVTDEERLLDTTEGNATVETEEAWINSKGMDYTVDEMANKESEHMGSFPMDTNLHMEDVLFDSFEGGSNYPLNVDDMGSLDCDYADMSYSLADNETDFLNVDDDDDDYEAAEEADDHIPDKHATVTDNSGWSSRTRAVANYLQTLFVKQGGNTKGSLEMDNLLIGKTRKEASRMFFEALVLKTKNYVDVEQAHPFDNISVRPHTKLMKSQF